MIRAGLFDVKAPIPPKTPPMYIFRPGFQSWPMPKARGWVQQQVYRECICHSNCHNQRQQFQHQLQFQVEFSFIFSYFLGF